jgi:diacylglycerol kinase (ATP)
MHTAIILANPAAKSTTAAYSTLERLANAIGDCPIEGHSTKSKEEFRALAHDCADKAPLILAAGGDGTVSDVMNGVISSGKRPIIGVISLGTGRAIGYEVGSPHLNLQSIDTIVHAIKNPHIKPQDLMLIDGEYCFLAGIGFGVELLQKVKQEEKKNMLQYAYQFSALLRSYPPFEATVELDGKHITKEAILDIEFTTIKNIGYGIKLMPQATSNGYIHGTIFDNSIKKSLIKTASSIMKGNYHGEYIRGKSITISTAKPIGIHLNGDETGTSTTNFSLQVAPHAIHLLTY